jgi:extradiol dioxygenase family protein
MTTSTIPALQITSGVLAHAPVVYLILYVNDLAESREFYERRLGLRAVERDEDSVKYDAGGIMLCLNVASQYGVTVAGRHDDASDVVFLVDDVNAMRDALEQRGVDFVRRRTYEIGLVTDFYDPNGHRLMLYQPSDKALSWPSGQKLRDVWRAFGHGGADLIGLPSVVEDRGKAIASGLDGKPVVYLFMFVPDSAAALAFYNASLGLQSMEAVHCCNPACPPEEKGIVKYDVGNLLLSTHHIHRSPVVDDFGKIYSAPSVNPAHLGGVVPVFHVNDIAGAVARLAAEGVAFTGDVLRSHRGDLARFSSATGHMFLLYEPSRGALQWPTGEKLQAIVEACRPR